MRKLASLVVGTIILSASAAAPAADVIHTSISRLGFGGAVPIQGYRGAFVLSDLQSPNGFRVFERPRSLLGGLPVFGGLITSGATTVRTTFTNRTPDGVDTFFNTLIR